MRRSGCLSPSVALFAVAIAVATIAWTEVDARAQFEAR